jgi:hypothetical protein
MIASRLRQSLMVLDYLSYKLISKPFLFLLLLTRYMFRLQNGHNQVQTQTSELHAVMKRFIYEKSFTTSRVVSPAGLGTKNDCAGEGQQQFTQPTD